MVTHIAVDVKVSLAAVSEQFGYEPTEIASVLA